MGAKDDWELKVATESLETTIHLLVDAGLPTLARHLKPYLTIMLEIKELRDKP